MAQGIKYTAAATLRPLWSALLCNMHLRAMQAGLAMVRAAMPSMRAAITSSPGKNSGQGAGQIHLWEVHPTTTTFLPHRQPVAV